MLEAIKDMDERDYAAFCKNQERIAKMYRGPFCDPDNLAGGLKIGALTFLVLVVGAFLYIPAAENLDLPQPEPFDEPLIGSIVALGLCLTFGFLLRVGADIAEDGDFESALQASPAICMGLLCLSAVCSGIIDVVHALFFL